MFLPKTCECPCSCSLRQVAKLCRYLWKKCKNLSVPQVVPPYFLGEDLHVWNPSQYHSVMMMIIGTGEKTEILNVSTDDMKP